MTLWKNAKPQFFLKSFLTLTAQPLLDHVAESGCKFWSLLSALHQLTQTLPLQPLLGKGVTLTQTVGWQKCNPYSTWPLLSAAPIYVCGNLYLWLDGVCASSNFGFSVSRLVQHDNDNVLSLRLIGQIMGQTESQRAKAWATNTICLWNTPHILDQLVMCLRKACTYTWTNNTNLHPQTPISVFLLKVPNLKCFFHKTSKSVSGLSLTWNYSKAALAFDK